MKWLTTTTTTTNNNNNNNNLMTKLCVHTDDMYMMTFIFFHHANWLSYIM
jgi:hypothetical protein